MRVCHFNTPSFLWVILYPLKIKKLLQQCHTLHNFLKDNVLKCGIEVAWWQQSQQNDYFCIHLEWKMCHLGAKRYSFFIIYIRYRNVVMMLPLTGINVTALR